MPLELDLDVSQNDQTIPEHLAHEANDESLRCRDAADSREAMAKRIRLYLSHPVHQKILAASRNHSHFQYGMFAIAYALCAKWEWAISKEIYAVLISGVEAWIVFATCLAIGFLASAGLAEST